MHGHVEKYMGKSYTLKKVALSCNIAIMRTKKTKQRKKGFLLLSLALGIFFFRTQENAKMVKVKMKTTVSKPWEFSPQIWIHIYFPIKLLFSLFCDGTLPGRIAPSPSAFLLANKWFIVTKQKIIISPTQHSILLVK